MSSECEAKCPDPQCVLGLRLQGQRTASALPHTMARRLAPGAGSIVAHPDRPPTGPPALGPPPTEHVEGSTCLQNVSPLESYRLIPHVYRISLVEFGYFQNVLAPLLHFLYFSFRERERERERCYGPCVPCLPCAVVFIDRLVA